MPDTTNIHQPPQWPHALGFGLLVAAMACGRVNGADVHDAATRDAGDGGLDGSSDASPPDASAMDGGTSSRWPFPAPGEPGAGPPCPEPPHASIGPDWPEVFVGVENCDDGGPGNRERPFCTFEKAFEVADSVPYIVTVRDGVYRQRSHRLIRPGTADAYFVVRAEEGAQPVILGSAPLDGSDFEPMDDGTWRIDVSALERDPKGLWTAEGVRILHVMTRRDGVRSHADVSELTEPNRWTKADGMGRGCGDDNAGCYVYVRPPEGMDVAATRFEASQGSFFYAGASHYLVVDGLTIHFTQSTAIFTEGARFVLIQNGSFAHNANGNDNSYSLRLWGADGAIVRHNRVSDSRYWEGGINSHGITFMIGGDEEDIWVCQNEIFDIVGYGVGTKSGASNVHVVGNWIHDVGTGVKAPGPRCHWRGCDERVWPGGGYDVRENLFERCETGVDIAAWSESTVGETFVSRIYNNTFVDTGRGILVRRQAKKPFARNNLFTGGSSGIQFRAGGTTTWPDFYLEDGFDSGFNLFDTDVAIYVYADWSGRERGMSLEEYRGEYGGEPNSIAAEPRLGPRFVPESSSPARGAGDPSVYEGASRVHIGLAPFAE